MKYVEAIQTRFEDKIGNLEKAVIEAKLATETIDVALTRPSC